MDLRQLHYFLAVAETQNVSRAATRVWISQPALSRQLQLLEKELGVRLFERKARGVTLTDAGEVLRRRAMNVMKDVSAMKEDVSAQATEPFGPVTLGIPSALRQFLTVPIAARFAQRYPNALLRIHEGTSRFIRDGVASGDTDVALFSTAEPSSPLDCVDLLTEQLFAVGRPEADLSMSRSINIAALCAHPLILTSYPNSLRTIVERAAAAAGCKVNACVEVDTSPLMLDLVGQGLGYAVLPYCAIHTPLKAKQLSACPVRGLTISWVAAFSRERTLSVAGSRLLEIIQLEVGQLIAGNQWPTAKVFARGQKSKR